MIQPCEKMAPAVCLPPSSFIAGVTALALACAVAAPAALAQGLQPNTHEAPGHVLQIEAIQSGLWLIRQPEAFQLQPIGNVTVIEQTNGLVIVDTGGSPGAGRRVVELIRSVSDKPVEAVIISHWHGDHPLGLSSILEAWPRAKVIAHEQTARHLTGAAMRDFPQASPAPERDLAFSERARQARDRLAQMAEDLNRPDWERLGYAAALPAFLALEADMAGVHVIAPNQTFATRLTLHDPKTPVEILHLGRANTDGDALVWLPRQRVVITGDIVVAPIPFGFGSYPADWIEVLNQIIGLDFTLLVPGHGPVQEDIVYLETLAAMLAAVRADAQEATDLGLDLAQTRARMDLTTFRDWFSQGDAWLAFWFDRYWTAPITAAAWKEAAGLEIIQGEP